MLRDFVKVSLGDRLMSFIQLKKLTCPYFLQKMCLLLICFYREKVNDYVVQPLVKNLSVCGKICHFVIL